MSYVVIIRGPLGIGKTTISERLVERVKGKYISIDSFMENKGLDIIDEKVGCIPKENFIEGNKRVIPEIRDILKGGKVVVVDGCFYHKEQIRDLIEDLDVPCYVFTLKAPLEVCIERDKERSRSLGKEATTKVFDLVTRFDFGTVIDTKDKNVDQVVEEVISYLPFKG